MPSLGVEYSPQAIDLQSLFGRQAPLTLEIGFGMGASLFEQARQHPERNFLGIEVHRPGVGSLLAKVDEAGLSNVRVSTHDAVEVLKQQIPADSIDRLQLFFPDPWPKKRHHKRRIVQTDFVELVRTRLVIGGVFHMATDWQNYAEHMLEVMSRAEGWRNLSPSGDYMPQPTDRPVTKFQQRGERLGHGVWDLMFAREA